MRAAEMEVVKRQEGANVESIVKAVNGDNEYIRYSLCIKASNITKK